MDTNAGRFVEEESAEKWMQSISVGETIKIKGEECEVVSIDGRELTLKLLSAEDRMRKELDATDFISSLRGSLIKDG